MKLRRSCEMVILLSCLLVGFAIRFYTFDQKSLWIDEVHTFNDSRDDLRGQLNFYKENPTYPHPPLFFILTHQFYPFTKPERDLRIIPLVFGTLSILMIYLLARQFSPRIALPCTLSLTFMTYHIYLSQDGRSYSLLMFLGMMGLYFFTKHLITLEKKYLFLTALLYGISFYISYTIIPFIIFSQLLWLYQMKEPAQKPHLSSFLLLNILILLLCIPWILFMALNYKGQSQFGETEVGSLWSILSNILTDWGLFAPLTLSLVILLVSFPFFSKIKRNGLLLLGILLLPPVSLYLICKLTNIQHYLNSRYLINFLPILFVSIYLSLEAIESKFEKLEKYFSLTLLFLILFIGSNMTILPFYYRAEKQDFRRLACYLGGQLQDGDKILVKSAAYIPGILHYFSVYPESRHYVLPMKWKDAEKGEFESKISLNSQNNKFAIYFSNISFSEYVEDQSRLWIVAGVPAGETIKRNFPCVLKGYFDGSFGNFRRFPSDASLYLFLWDPKSSGEKGIDTPIKEN